MIGRTLPKRVGLVLSDVDGTLVTRDKRLTDSAIAAVGALRGADIAFSVASSRPPFGLRAILDKLGVDKPIASFNGGVILSPDGSVLSSHYAPPEVAAAAIAFFEDQGVQVWAFTSTQWLCKDEEAAFVAHERMTVAQAPTLVSSFTPYLGELGKIVAVSANTDALAQCESDARERFGEVAMVARSQAYYLDVTNLKANKADALHSIAAAAAAPLSECVALGDGGNDVGMLRAAGYGIAMGNAVEATKAAADFVTASNEDEGFSLAIEHILESLR